MNEDDFKTSNYTEENISMALKVVIVNSIFSHALCKYTVYY